MLKTTNSNLSILLSALGAFTTLVEAKTPLSIRHFFFGVTLTAHEKKEGAVKPIAVGCTLRHLVAKIVGNQVMQDMASVLAPKQLGFGVRGGAEAAVHATRQYIRYLQSDHTVLKLDFKNAFNSVRRHKLLRVIQVLAPEIYPFVLCLLHPTFLGGPVPAVC